MKLTRGFTFFLIAMLLAGCEVGDEGVTATVSPMAISIPTDTNTPTPTMRPTSIPAPTQTPSPTPITHIDVPDWLGDPDVNVLMIETEDRENNTVSLYNAITGEKFDLPESIKRIGGAFFWITNGKSVGIVSRDKQTIILINTLTGMVNYQTVSGKDLEFVGFPSQANSPLIPLVAHSDPLLIASYTLANLGLRYEQISPSGKYAIQVDPVNSRYTEILDLSTWEVSRITSEDDIYYDVDFSWLPKSNYLSILQQTQPPHIYDEEIVEPRVVLYDPERRKILSYFDGISQIEWSPDATQILFDRYGSNYWGISTNFINVPCTFSVLSGDTTCFDNIRTRHGSQSLWDFTWSPNGKLLSYTYQGLTSDPYFETGGLCIMTLSSKTISCPTDQITELNVSEWKQLSSVSYVWSPDSKHIAMTAGDCVACDYLSSPVRIVILSADGSYYHYLDGTDASYWFRGLWRPPITG